MNPHNRPTIQHRNIVPSILYTSTSPATLDTPSTIQNANQAMTASHRPPPSHIARITRFAPAKALECMLEWNAPST